MRLAVGKSCALGVLLIAAAILFGMPSEAWAKEKTGPLRKFGTWELYHYKFDGKSICFLAARAKKLRPAKISRGTVRFYISNWLAGGGKKPRQEEVSVLAGIRLKAGNSATVIVDGKKFALFADGQTGFMRKKDREKRLIKALRKGRRLKVESRSASGALLTDTYSLKGSAKAIDTFRKNCKAGGS